MSKAHCDNKHRKMHKLYLQLYLFVAASLLLLAAFFFYRTYKLNILLRSVELGNTNDWIQYQWVTDSKLYAFHYNEAKGVGLAQHNVPIGNFAKMENFNTKQSKNIGVVHSATFEISNSNVTEIEPAHTFAYNLLITPDNQNVIFCSTPPSSSYTLASIETGNIKRIIKLKEDGYVALLSNSNAFVLSESKGGYRLTLCNLISEKNTQFFIPYNHGDDSNPINIVGSYQEQLITYEKLRDNHYQMMLYTPTPNQGNLKAMPYSNFSLPKGQSLCKVLISPDNQRHLIISSSKVEPDYFQSILQKFAFRNKERQETVYHFYLQEKEKSELVKIGNISIEQFSDFNLNHIQWLPSNDAVSYIYQKQLNRLQLVNP